MSALSFDIQHRASWCAARVGRVTTPHGSFDTPAFMPVGTQGTIKGLLPDLVADTGAQIALGNTYHLLLRPGPELVARMGGLQHWSRWQRPMLTDSGGFQVFSLGHLNKLSDQGVTFKSHIDGKLIDLSPERSIAVQNMLGADIIMAMDDCPPATDTARVEQAVQRTLQWLDRSMQAHQRPDAQALFGIVQGGTDLSLRTFCATQVTQRDLPGYAIGGVAVGESFDAMKRVVEHTAPLLPVNKPRYLMGVGYERDLWMAVQAGVDMFDCVLPTRNGRNASAFTRTGSIRLRNAKYADDAGPIEEGCDCPACGGNIDAKLDVLANSKFDGFDCGSSHKIRNSKFNCFSRSYLRHLFMTGEMLGPILVSLHNLRHFQRLMLDIRQSIRDNDPSAISRNWPVIAGGCH